MAGTLEVKGSLLEHQPLSEALSQNLVNTPGLDSSAENSDEPMSFP